MSIDKPVVTKKDMENFASERLRKTPLSDMRLRDYFAGLAMQGDMAFDPLSPGIDDEKLQKIASHYYRIADAMLRARGE